MSDAKTTDEPVIQFEFDDMQKVNAILHQDPHFIRTAIQSFPPNASDDIEDFRRTNNVLLKCENVQYTGSFKFRGVVNQFRRLLQSGDGSHRPALVTMSAGNYGKAFATMCGSTGVKGTVLVPSTCSTSRVEMLRKLGVQVEMHPSADLSAKISEHVTMFGEIFLHPFDDKDLLLGYSSLGLELLEDIADPGPDVVLIGCGGGGLLSAVSTCIRKSGCWPNCRIFGVEPVTANTMWQSLSQGCPVANGQAHSVARGLAPPYVGAQFCFPLCQRYVDGVLLVDEKEIAEATLILQKNNALIPLEPSGAAAFAAWWFGKVPNLPQQATVCIVLSGGNVDEEQMETVRNLALQ